MTATEQRIVEAAILSMPSFYTDVIEPEAAAAEPFPELRGVIATARALGGSSDQILALCVSVLEQQDR